jgi:protein involved in polysaccharide export with SLBB domain
MTTASNFLGRWGAILGILMAGFGMAGCKSGAPDSQFAPVPGTAADAGLTAAVTNAATSLGATNLDSTPGIDMIHIGDTLQIVFSDLPTPMPPIEERVREDGTITLLQNQTFQAAGKSRGDLEREIRKRYVPDYYLSMTVSVRPQTNTQFYYVGGDVKSPGRQVYLSRLTVLKAIQSCGDFTDFGAKKRVQLTRADGRSFKIDCKKARTDPKLDLEVLPGDTIFVPRKINPFE